MGNDLTIEIPDKVKMILQILNDNGFEAYAVGGCVRDSLLKREPGDWDITTSALPAQVKGLFRRTIDTGLAHGTVTVMLGKEGFEVTTYRVDGVYDDGRHPRQVTFTASLEEDLKRRDFTINAMAYNPSAGIIDIFQGQEDLAQGVIRCVGNPEDRFGEDALRMMRAVRFAGQLGFVIDGATREAICKLSPNMKKISAERIRVEMLKLLVSPHPELFRELYETGITAVILPEFDTAMKTSQNTPYHCYGVGDHILHVIENVEPEPALRLAALFHDLAKPCVRRTDSEGIDHFNTHAEKGELLARDIMKNRLKFDNETIRKVSRLVRWHDYRMKEDKVSVRRGMNLAGTDLFPDLLKLMRADNMAKAVSIKEESLRNLEVVSRLYQEIVEAGECVDLKALAVTGEDLIAVGFKPGKELGQLLERLLMHVIEVPEDNQKEILLKIAGSER